MNEVNTQVVMLPEESIPDWYDGKRINEVLFCQQFLKKHPMKAVLKKAPDEVCSWQAVYGRWADRRRGADRQSHSGGNFRLSDIRTFKGSGKSAFQHQAASLFAASAH